MKSETERLRPSLLTNTVRARTPISHYLREREQVLSYASAGYIDKQISVELGVSENTLRTYWARIRRKDRRSPAECVGIRLCQASCGGGSCRTEPSVTSGSYIPAIRLDGNPLPGFCDEQSPDWIIDLERETFTRMTSRPLTMETTVGEEVPFSEILSKIDPNDRDRIQSLFLGAKAGELSEFVISNNVITSEGMRPVRAVVRVKKNGAENPRWLLGWNIVDFQLAVKVGNWTRNLQSGAANYDAGFRSIFRLDGDAGDLRHKIISRFSPADTEAAKRLFSDHPISRRTRVRSTSTLEFGDQSRVRVVLWLTMTRGNEGVEAIHGTVVAF